MPLVGDIFRSIFKDRVIEPELIGIDLRDRGARAGPAKAARDVEPPLPELGCFGGLRRSER